MGEQTKSSGLATAAMVLGIIGVVLSFIPLINNLAFVLGVLAAIFAIIALSKKASKGKAITGLVLGILSIVITLLMQQALGNAIDDALAPTKKSDNSESTKKDDSSSTKPDEFDGEATYKSIKTGMTKAEVTKVAGVDPDSCTKSETDSMTMETCSYGNIIKDKVTVSVTFMDGKVSDKTKFSS